jgi:hypothetical protein
MTKAIIAVAGPLGISVHDHLIVGKDEHASLKGAEADLRWSRRLDFRESLVCPEHTFRIRSAERAQNRL